MHLALPHAGTTVRSSPAAGQPAEKSLSPLPSSRVFWSKPKIDCAFFASPARITSSLEPTRVSMANNLNQTEEPLRHRFHTNTPMVYTRSMTLPLPLLLAAADADADDAAAVSAKKIHSTCPLDQTQGSQKSNRTYVLDR